jgi:signal transduction histidine kinase
VDHLQKLIRQTRLYLFIALAVASNVVVLLAWIIVHLHLPDWIILAGGSVVAIAISFTGAILFTDYFTEPIRFIWQAILHVSPATHGIEAPNIEQVRFSRELVSSLAAQVYQIASVAENVAAAQQRQRNSLSANFVANNLPLPLLVLSGNETILFANQAALQYLAKSATDLVGQNVYSQVDMAFQSENTLDKWLFTSRQQTATNVNTWDHVKLTLSDGSTKFFDLAAYYNKDNPESYETMLVLFDHTAKYNVDDQDMSFLALCVHELRTPLTLLRGYIEAFEDELSGSVTPEMKDFMYKMNASAQQLAAFVNNILNLARVEDDQLLLELHEEDWGTLIRNAANNLALRAKVRGIRLEFSVAPNLPKVGVDRVSIYEVISNLVDNAIKYSGKSNRIRIDTHLTQDGLVETTIQDWGVGIPESGMPNLFTKFYRNHRNRAQIGGTGLGLYLSKAIVTAHGGNIWVRSKEGEGTTFGFTVQPYTQLADGVKNSDNKDIVRGAHGWIKNHTLYRR